ncbi:hypothetical protein SCLCIDRAFT_29625 [Scleroderma citrinum Foug A]|uniref:Xylulose kinase n=1 Tax=Scleroderma citrinum Foug A TaxID=1036808 RepID=A0A0C3DJY3_9AGAM|nr:hypothetical protein SCLCIDRAFT_29625 [Scleroderma citrinum Foug A]
MPSSEALLLGFDLSTQQLKAVLITAHSLSVVHEASVYYDTDLPSYGTSNGAILGPDEGRVTSPVSMWLEALDLILERIRTAGIDLGRVIGIGGAGQQHGSVYWSLDAPSLLASLDPSKALGAPGHLAPQAFSLPDAPIWQDSSTTVECRGLEDAVGGSQALSDLTGSRAFELFTGVQITRRIAPIEVSDASGMSLMNILASRWEDTLLDACGGPELRAKLESEPVLGGSALGKVGTWWVQRWEFSPECIIAPFTGDNPTTVVALSAHGDAILSLCTSTTLHLSIPPPLSTVVPSTPPKCTMTSHLLAHPVAPGGYIAMLCYKNGALARERPEIIPPNITGEFFFKPDAGVTSMAAVPEVVFPPFSHPREILESQLLSIKLRVVDIVLPSAPPLHRLVLAGRASSNTVIQQVVADVFGSSTYIAERKAGTHEAAAFGGALLTWYAWWGNIRVERGTFEDMMEEVHCDRHNTDENGQIRSLAEPDVEAARVYI